MGRSAAVSERPTAGRPEGVLWHRVPQASPGEAAAAGLGGTAALRGQCRDAPSDVQRSVWSARGLSLRWNGPRPAKAPKAFGALQTLRAIRV